MKEIFAILLASASFYASAQNTVFNSPSNGYQGNAGQTVQTPQGRYVPTYDGMTGNQELAGRNYGSGQQVAPIYGVQTNGMASSTDSNGNYQAPNTTSPQELGRRW